MSRKGGEKNGYVFSANPSEQSSVWYRTFQIAKNAIWKKYEQSKKRRVRYWLANNR